MVQIVLPLDIRGGAAPVAIVVGKANRAAVEALQMPERWPFRTAVLVAPRRAGKSLIARWFGAGAGNEVLDDAHWLSETSVFHAWNRAQEQDRPLLLTAAPGWQVALPDLASRLGGSLQLAIDEPDDDLMARLIAAHAEQRRLALDEGAAAYLTPRIERSWEAVEAIVGTIDRLSLERQAPATLSIWRDALEAVQGPEQGRLL